MRARTSVWVALWLLGAGCYADRVVGTSGSGASSASPTVSSKPRVPSRILPRPNETIGVDSPNLGDIDADGFDDFVVRSSPYAPEIDDKSLTGTRYYLYYGRREFPMQLSTADADAVLVSDQAYFLTALGDVNGDGFADFAIMRQHGRVQFFFGSRERLHGEVVAGAGVIWRHPGFERRTEDSGILELMLSAAGDWNDDGLDDLFVRASLPMPIEDPDHGFIASDSTRLVLGTRGKWASAAWDPSWGVAEFGFQIVDTGVPESPTAIDAMLPIGGGDVDGDGRDDLFGLSYADPLGGLYVFYGGRTLPREILASHADAAMALPADFELLSFDDIDADGGLDFVLHKQDGSQIRIVYGERWSGRGRVEPQLTIDVDSLALYTSVMTGDIDGDGAPEIVFASGRSFADDGALELAVYVIRGSSERLTGHIQLDETYLLAREAFPRPSSKFAGLGGLGLVMAGDVDGDGGRDMLSSVVRTADDPGGVTLIPSGPRPPQ